MGIGAQILSSDAPVSTQAAAPQVDGEVVEGSVATGNKDPRMDLVARMERKAREEREAAKRERAEAEQLMSKYKDREEEDKLWETNPLELIKKKKGWGFEELSDFALKNTSEDDLDPVSKKFKDYETRIEQMRKELTDEFETKLSAKEQEYTTRQQEQMRDTYKERLGDFLEANKSTYELLATSESGREDVFDLIAADIERQKEAGASEKELKLMDMKEAFDKVEAFYEKQLDESLGKYKQLNKFKSRVGMSPESVWSLNTSEKETLSNDITPKSSQNPEQLSMEQRIELASEMMRKGLFA